MLSQKNISLKFEEMVVHRYTGRSGSDPAEQQPDTALQNKRQTSVSLRFKPAVAFTSKLQLQLQLQAIQFRELTYQRLPSLTAEQRLTSRMCLWSPFIYCKDQDRSSDSSVRQQVTGWFLHSIQTATRA
jgi:hypothetical protein